MVTYRIRWRRYEKKVKITDVEKVVGTVTWIVLEKDTQSSILREKRVRREFCLFVLLEISNKKSFNETCLGWDW